MVVALCVVRTAGLGKPPVTPRSDICLHQAELYAGPYLRRVEPHTGAAQVIWDKAFITCMASDGRDLWLGTRVETVVRLSFADDGAIAEEQKWSLVPLLHEGEFPHPDLFREHHGVYDVRPSARTVYAFTECGYGELDRATGAWQRRRGFCSSDREPIGIVGATRPVAFLSLQLAPRDQPRDADWVIQSIDTGEDLISIPVEASINSRQPPPGRTSVEYRGLSSVLTWGDTTWIVGGGGYGYNRRLLLRYGPDRGVVERFDLGIKHGTVSDACLQDDVIWLSVWRHEGGSLIRFDCKTCESEIFPYDGPMYLERLAADRDWVYIYGLSLEPGWSARDTSRLVRFDIHTREFSLLPTPPVDVRIEDMWGPGAAH